jgi:flagellar motility protein MotE (MotC chaperone)
VEAPKAAALPGTVAPKPPEVASGPPPISEGERTVLLELRQRRLELDGREATLAARESVLVATEQKLSARVAELQALQKKLEGLETAREQREDTSWRGLVKVYESMKPRDAAVIFNDLDMPVLLQVVDRMKEAKAAPVLAAMQADKARELTTKLADMRTRRDNPSGT